MYSDFGDYARASSRSSRQPPSDEIWRRTQPAYQEPDLYDTSRYARHEQRSLSPLRPHHAGRSPTRRNSPTPSMSPPPVPVPSKPSQEYLSVSAEGPRTVDHKEQRKLLILDLNGTLLWRKDRRIPYPRPYMPTFRAYIFAEETRKWLDVMVWSSAQPHNVEMMVRRCFFDKRCGYNPKEVQPGTDKWEGLLIAVWARDTLGLSKHDYSRKSKTTKDLSKPWTILQGVQKHSALTTILLDDSPAKVRLQPYNHVCVLEYCEKTRNRDKRVKHKLLSEWMKISVANKELTNRPNVMNAVEVSASGLSNTNVFPLPASTSNQTLEAHKHSEETTKGSFPDSSISSLQAEKGSDTEIKEKTRAEKRKEKRERMIQEKKQEKMVLRKLEENGLKVPEVRELIEAKVSKQTESKVPENEDPAIAKSRVEDRTLDETLLGVIGILDEIKTQGNVAAWIRSGGLWAENVPPILVDQDHDTDPWSLFGGITRAPSPTDAEIEEPEVYPSETSEATPFVRSSPPSSPSAAQYRSSSGTASPIQSPSLDRKRVRSATADAPSAREGESDAKKSKADRTEIDHTIPTGNDAETVVEQSLIRSNGHERDTHLVASTKVLKHKDFEGAAVTSPRMWFEDEETFKYWVDRGRKALKSLGIDEQDGIELP